MKQTMKKNFKTLKKINITSNKKMIKYNNNKILKIQYNTGNLYSRKFKILMLKFNKNLRILTKRNLNLN